ncbi:MAG: hypothetical protein RR269_02120 [Oscillospiraceae bacterium]
MKLIRQILLSFAAILAVALTFGIGAAIGVAASLLLTQVVLGALGKHLKGIYRVLGAIILEAGFAFSGILAALALFPQWQLEPLFPGFVFLEKSFAGLLIFALLAALVQAFMGECRLPGVLGFTKTPRAFRGLPIIALTAALLLMTLDGFIGLRI